MPCQPFFGGVACVRGGRRRASCDFCTREHVALCDHRVAGGKDCDAKVCEQHRTSIGPNLDACPNHIKAESLQPTLL